MQRIYTSIAASALFVFSLLSCKKDDGGSNSPNNSNLNSVEQKIVGTWRVESKTYVYTAPNGAVTTNDQLDACEKDDTYTFKSDKTYTVSGGTTPCSFAMSYDTPFTWYVETRDSTFGFTHGPGLQTYPRVESVDNTTLIISAHISSASKTTYIYKRK